MQQRQKRKEASGFRNPLPFAALLVGSLCNGQSVAGSFFLVENTSGNYDYLRQNSIPANFGTGEFTLELWVRLDDSYAVGSTASGTGQRQNWSNANPAPYSAADWWYAGNFLLDGHNNSNFSNGTFSLQVFNGGRLRWLFGDGSPASSRTGGLHAVQNASSASLRDGQWHQVTLVRRANGPGATLEMWIDGSLVDSETSSAMPDMRTWWNSWPGFPGSQSGWFWGAEKQAAIGVLSQYEDYKGNIDELRFWSVAKSPAAIAANYAAPITGSEIGLAGHFVFEGSACSQAVDTSCMTAVNLQAGAWSAASAPLTAGGDATPPTTPGNLESLSTQSTSVALDWSPSSDNVAVTSYRVTRNGVTLSSSVTATAYTDTGLSPATLYSYTVTALDAAGNASAAAPLQVTTLAAPDTQAPSVPANLQATGTTASRVDLVWSLASDNVGVTGYLIYRGGVLVGNTTSLAFSDTTVVANTTYGYTIAARDAAGNVSAQSTTLTVTTPMAPGGGDTTSPTVPANLRVTANTATSVALAWNAANDSVGVTGYLIYRGGVLLGNATSLSFSDTTVVANTAYSYRIAARDAAGNVSAQSASLAVTTPQAPGGGDTTPPAVPANLRVTANSATTVALAWNAATDNVGVTGYLIYRGGVLVGNATSLSFSDTTVVANTAYSYTISARDAAGNASAQSATLAVTTPAVPLGGDTTPPTVPSNLSVTGNSSTAVEIAWNAATDNVGVTGYLIYRGGVLVGNAAALSFSDATVAANTAYSYTIAARDAAGNSSAQSTALSVTTPAAPSGGGAPGGGGTTSSGGGGGAFGLEFLSLLLLAPFARLRKRGKSRAFTP